MYVCMYVIYICGAFIRKMCDLSKYLKPIKTPADTLPRARWWLTRY